MLFVDCLVVLQEYFASESDEVTVFFLEVLFILRVMSGIMFATQLLL